MNIYIIINNIYYLSIFIYYVYLLKTALQEVLQILQNLYENLVMTQILIRLGRIAEESQKSRRRVAKESRKSRRRVAEESQVNRRRSPAICRRFAVEFSVLY